MDKRQVGNRFYFCLKLLNMTLKLKSIAIIIFTCVLNYTNAQNTSPCGTDHISRTWFDGHKSEKKLYENKMLRCQQNIKSHSFELRSDTIYTIPVVFHILHEGGSENISEAQVRDQIRILNRDYQKQNADTASIVPAFKNNIANVGFNFQLATIDPEGKCTNGINRYYSSKTVWDANKFEDFIYTWPPSKYLNIYIVRSINIAPAYTFLPGIGTPEYTDVIVCQSNLVGSIGTASIANSRALTHEVGHWFGLPHIWGVSNAPGVVCGDDYVDDTPITKGFIACSTNASKVCDPAIEENLQNYMDYTPCKQMFTNGQSKFMRQIITTGVNKRNVLISEENLKATGVIEGNICNTKADFFTLNYIICNDDKIKLQSLCNGGKGKLDLLWVFEGGTPNESNDSLVEVTYNQAGSYKIKLYAYGDNGNDTIERTIQVWDKSKSKQPDIAYTFSDLEVPEDFKIQNVQGDVVQWDANSFVGANATKGCMFLNNYSSTSTQNHEDYFETTTYDFTNASKPRMSFYYSYARKFDNQNDVFKIEYTLDCGKTWKLLPSVPNLTTMANMTGGTTDSDYVPQTVDKWKQVTLTTSFISLFKNKPNVRFRFYFKSDPNALGSNNLFLDEINIFDPTLTSIKDAGPSLISIQPNPALINTPIKIMSANDEIDKVVVYDLNGIIKEVIFENTYESGYKVFYANQNLNLLPGIYFAKFWSNAKYNDVRKIVITTNE